MFLLRSIGISLLFTSLAAGQRGQAPTTIVPGENLVAEGIPAIPAAIADDVLRYTEARAVGFSNWHPTERKILITTRFGDVNQLHQVGAPGAFRQQLTFFPDRVLGGSFQPTTGEYMVFTKDVGGGEWFQFYRYDLKDGAITLLTDGKSRNTSPQWSTKGDRIAYTSNRRSNSDFDVHLIDPRDPKSNRMILQLQGNGWGVQDWSADDSKFALMEFISANESYIWIVDAASGEKKLLTPKNAGEEVSYSGVEFTPDGKGMWTTSDRGSEFSRLAYIDLVTGKETPLANNINWDVTAFDLSEDGKLLAYVTNENGLSVLRILDTATRKERPIPKLPVGIYGGLEFHKSGKELGFTINSARTPSDMYSLSVATGKLERWTFSETGGINLAELPEPKLIEWKSFDGMKITGFYYAPPAKFTGKRPVIVNIHGGPEGQARPNFIGRSNYFLNEMGIAIIYPNVRGSTGYGKSFLAADNGMKREDTYKDIDALVDWIKVQPDLDGDRIMVTGGSYGGHMALAVATNYNDKIRASLASVPPSNFVTFLENTESYRRDLRRAEYGDERDPQIREFLMRSAPLTKAANIKKPLFVVQGGNDPRVPKSESEQIVAAARKNGSPVWYLMAKDEGHGFAKKKNQDFQFYATVMFIREFLLK
jgi:dipeptidyl aminopeptidase/acylaminoacyl peptidase